MRLRPYKDSLKAWFAVGIALYVLMAFSPAQSATFPYLFHGVVEGDGRQPTAAENRRALQQVLIRLTGIDKPETVPALLELLNNSSQLVSEYELLPPGAGTRPRFRIGFHRNELTRYLQTEGLSIWDNNHPLILLFVASIDGSHPARILAAGDRSSEAAPMRMLIENLKFEKGLLLTLPIHDYEEERLVIDRILQGQYHRAARILRDRYQVEAVIIVHFEQMGVNYWYAESRFLGDIEGRIPIGEYRSIEQVLQDTIDRLGRYYWSLNARKPRLARGLQLVVQGAKSFAAFQQVTALLRETLPTEQQPVLVRMTEDQLEFDFRSEFSITRIRRLLEASRDFKLIEGRPNPGTVTQIHVSLLAQDSAPAIPDNESFR